MQPLKEKHFWLSLFLPFFLFFFLQTVSNLFGQDKPPVASTPAAAPPADPPPEEAPPADGEPAPPPPADPAKVTKEAEELFKAGKLPEIITLVDAEQNKPAISESPLLCEIYLQALLAEGKPDFGKINDAGTKLLAKDKENPWGNFAMGRFWSEGAGKRIDLGKAMTFLGKAKGGKNPPGDAAKMYYMVMAKRFGMYAGLGLLALIVVIVKAKKKKPPVDVPIAATENPDEDALALEGFTALAVEKPAEKPQAPPTKVEKTPTPPPAAAEKPKQEPPPPQPIPAKTAVSTEPPKPPPGAPSPAQPPQIAMPPADSGFSSSPMPPTPDAASFYAATSAVPPRPAPPPPQPIAVPEPPRREINKADYIIIDLGNTPGADSQGLATRKPELPTGTDVESLWQRLRKNAAKKPIPPDQGNSLEVVLGLKRLPPKPVPAPPPPGKAAPIQPSPYPADDSPGSMYGMYDKAASQEVPDFNAESQALGDVTPPDFSSHSPVLETPDPFPGQEVSLDLTEESLKDDLLGKVKMMAIDDSDLRKLMLQRNPDHLPILFEYVMMNPEPVRLAYVARELGFYHDAAVCDVLSSLLYHEDQRVILSAIQGLQENGGSSALLNICPFIKSNTPILAESAKAALTSFGPKKILAAFSELPNHPDERVRDAGVFILSRMKGQPVTRILLEMLKDKSETIRCQVILAMTYQKDPVFIDYLRQVFKTATEGNEKILARKAMVFLQGFTPKPASPTRR